MKLIDVSTRSLDAKSEVCCVWKKISPQAITELCGEILKCKTVKILLYDNGELDARFIYDHAEAE